MLKMMGGAPEETGGDAEAGGGTAGHQHHAHGQPTR
jgi:hypothetical protein